MQTGREITSNPAVYVTKKDGTRYIGVRRDVLKDPMQFVQNYIHERGHDITKADDYDRGFAGFFIERLAREATKQLRLNETNEDYSI
jgi:hypothetical protein